MITFVIINDLINNLGVECSIVGYFSGGKFESKDFWPTSSHYFPITVNPKKKKHIWKEEESNLGPLAKQPTPVASRPWHLGLESSR